MKLSRFFKTAAYVSFIIPFFYVGALNSVINVSPTSPKDNTLQIPNDSHPFDSKKPNPATNPTTNPGYKAGVNPQGYHLPPQRKLPPAPKLHPESSTGQQKYHPGGSTGGGSGY